MIIGNQSWQTALGQNVKQPLYVLQIAAFGIFLSSFSAGLITLLGGYGVIPYGLGGYGI